MMPQLAPQLHSCRGMTTRHGRASRAIAAALGGVALMAALTGSRPAGSRSRATATPVLWKDPGDVGSLDLRWGPGSPARAPRPPFHFRKEDMDGTKPKVHVIDARGMRWSVKFDDGTNGGRGREVPAEIAAGRIVWALGYLVEETYFVKSGVIDGVRGLKRAGRVLGPGGRFRNARFERRPRDVERLGTRWSLRDNPFVGSRELSGLIILVALLNNWDVRGANTAVFRVNSGGIQEDWYVISDLGTAFGSMFGGVFRKPTRWNVEDYRSDRAFIVRADSKTVEFYYQPDGTDRARVPLEQARWFSQLASRLSGHQLRQAFAAAGASQVETQSFSERLMEKLAELRAAILEAQSRMLHP